MRKLICGVMAILMCACAFAGCKKNEEANQQENSQQERSEKNIISKNLPYTIENIDTSKYETVDVEEGKLVNLNIDEGIGCTFNIIGNNLIAEKSYGEGRVIKSYDGETLKEVASKPLSSRACVDFFNNHIVVFNEKSIVLYDEKFNEIKTIDFDESSPYYTDKYIDYPHAKMIDYNHIAWIAKNQSVSVMDINSKEIVSMNNDLQGRKYRGHFIYPIIHSGELTVCGTVDDSQELIALTYNLENGEITSVLNSEDYDQKCIVDPFNNKLYLTKSLDSTTSIFNEASIEKYNTFGNNICGCKSDKDAGKLECYDANQKKTYLLKDESVLKDSVISICHKDSKTYIILFHYISDEKNELYACKVD